MPTQLPDDDDAIAEALADEVIERILKDHPQGSSEFRKSLVGLYLRRATGSIGDQEPATLNDLSEVFGSAPQRLSECVSDGVLKLRANKELTALWLDYTRRHPDLLDS